MGASARNFEACRCADGQSGERADSAPFDGTQSRYAASTLCRPGADAGNDPEFIRVFAAPMARTDQLLPLGRGPRQESRKFRAECRRRGACALPVAQFRRKYTRCEADEWRGI